MEDKDLLQQHPLFKKLSGQIVWYMFEERETPQEEIDEFFTHMEACRVETLKAMRQLLDPSSSDGEAPWLLVEVEHGPEPAPPCERCKSMHGKLLPPDHPRLLEYMPPYSVGCRARPRAISAEQARERLEANPQLLPEPPGHMLHCPSEWMFGHEQE